jgi:hypothetical protein
MIDDALRKKIEAAVHPYEVGFEGGKFGGDPIKYRVTNQSGTTLLSGRLAKSEYSDEAVLEVRIEEIREALGLDC